MDSICSGVIGLRKLGALREAVYVQSDPAALSRSRLRQKGLITHGLGLGFRIEGLGVLGLGFWFRVSRQGLLVEF